MHDRLNVKRLLGISVLTSAVAKQVMGVKRDPDAWWKSMGNLNKVSSPWWLPYFLAPMPTWRWFPAFIEGIRGRGKLGAKVSGNVVPGPRTSAPLPATIPASH